jgi:hypothetical protein
MSVGAGSLTQLEPVLEAVPTPLLLIEPGTARVLYINPAAHRFAGGRAPAKLTGRRYTEQCWGDVIRTLGAVAIAAGILALVTEWVSHPARTQALTQWYGVLGIILAIEFIWALSYTVWPRKAV